MIIAFPSATLIVLCLVASLLGGGAFWLAGKMQLPAWASVAVALFVFGIILLVAKV